MNQITERPGLAGHGAGEAFKTRNASIAATATKTMRALALGYAERGWPVFPCRPGGKTPMTPHGFKDATTDPAKIKAWWKRWPDANPAIATGKDSGVVVWDFDNKHGKPGLKTYEQLEQEHGPFNTLLYSTPTGGINAIFEYTKTGNRTNILPGLDIRGDGGYIVAPGSQTVYDEKRDTVDGEYKWLNSLPPATHPEGLKNLLLNGKVKSNGGGANGGTATGVAAPGGTAFDRATVLSGVPEGERDDALFRYASSLQARHVDQAEAVVLVREAAANCDPPFPEKDALKKVEQVYKRYAANDAPLLSPAAPLPSAREFVKQRYTRNERRLLHRLGGDFYVYSGDSYRVIDDPTIIAELWAYLDNAKAKTKDGIGPFKPTRNKVADVVAALKAATHLDSHTFAPPCWLDGCDGPPAAEILQCANGLLHLPTGELRPSTPLFFGLNALPFDFVHDEPPPAPWLSFLHQLWPDDSESVSTLQEVFGYLLTQDTSQQKIILIVGPKRGGKGTIARILTAMLGQANVAGPTLAGLGQNFGLAPLIGKSCAIISDARLSTRADQAVIAERLLSISGEDSLTIDRKYRDPWTGRLPVRFLVLTNELPRLADASGALASRFIVLMLKNSFYGKEDPKLTDKLLQELPGILNWAIAGWHRLRQRGYFIQPETSRDAIDELEVLGSPIGAFVKECCAVEPGLSVPVDALFHAWRFWCQEQGRYHPGTKQTFGRDLGSAVPGLRVGQHRTADGVVRRYDGIGLV